MKLKQPIHVLPSSNSDFMISLSEPSYKIFSALSFQFQRVTNRQNIVASAIFYFQLLQDEFFCILNESFLTKRADLTCYCIFVMSLRNARCTTALLLSASAGFSV